MQQLDGLKEKTNEELLVLYKKDQQLEVKQELTLRYLYIAKAVAIQMHNLYSDFMQMEDIINEGAIAIMKGIERYDPSRDNKFETFISRRIRGMIIDIIRKNDWMPRNYHKQYRSIEEARAELAERLGHLPTDEEIAGHLKMDVRKCQKLQRMSTMVNVLSLDMVTRREEEGQSVQIRSDNMDLQPESAYMKDEAVKTLTAAVNKLKEKERMVISLYYVEDLNMTQIAQVMGVSEPRISQIHSGAIRKLKTYMNTYAY